MWQQQQQQQQQQQHRKMNEIGNDGGHRRLSRHNTKPYAWTTELVTDM